MRLYLVQHGEACGKDVDPERPLTEQGRSDINHLARFLQQADVRVDRVMHSGKLRAQQTAECLAMAIAPAIVAEVCGLINPDDNPMDIDWRGECQGKDTLVVGHLPYIEKLISALIVANENQVITAFLPGSMVCLVLNDEQWRISWMLNPRLLNASSLITNV